MMEMLEMRKSDGNTGDTSCFLHMHSLISEIFQMTSQSKKKHKERITQWAVLPKAWPVHEEK